MKYVSLPGLLTVYFRRSYVNKVSMSFEDGAVTIKSSIVTKMKIASEERCLY